MSGSKPIPLAALFLLLILSIMSSFKLIHCIGNNSTTFCPEIEKEALLSFKQSLRDPSNLLLSSWNDTHEVNCCKWKGVVCSNFTGHVHQLHLRSLSGKISPSLLNLKHLRYLDLSLNDFNETIPSFIGSLTSLEYLNLSRAGFQGIIPHTIGNLSNLRTLSLEPDGTYGSPINVESLEWLLGLSRLEHLNMNYVDLSRAANWVQVINTLPSLTELYFVQCGLDIITHSLNHVNMTSLEVLDLSYNYMPYPVPRWIFQLSNLIFLDLHDNFFDGPIPTISNTTKLRYIDLSYNNLNSTIPDWLYFCKDLEFLSLKGSSLHGTIFASIENLTSLSNLIFLDLSDNSFEGPIPTISNTTSLRHIDLSLNSFNSTIPDWLYFCKDLEFLSLSGNLLHGKISASIANLTSLSTLDLSHNDLSGKFPREIANMCDMQKLDLSSNRLDGEIRESFGNMPDCFLGSLEHLDLRDNQLSGHLTDQFGEFKSLQYLYLSGNSMSGSIPRNVGNLSSLVDLDMSGNKLTGNLPSLGQLYNLEALSITGNMLEGVVTESHFANLTKLTALRASGNNLTLRVSPNWIPPFKLNVLRLGSWNLGAESQILSWLETQKNISMLDLSNTGISGDVPSWLWDIPYFYLDLSQNQLHGSIPITREPEDGRQPTIYLSSNKFSGPLPRVGKTVLELDLYNNSFSGGISHFLCDKTNGTYILEVLHLGGNQLTGEIPDCWVKWPRLRYLNLGNNIMSGSIPDSIGFLGYLGYLNVYRNKFSGKIPLSINNCTKLVKIDLAHNDLHGNLPTWMGVLRLRFLILRSNKFSGRISSDICRLSSLQILDLSDNKLSGMIPKCVNNFTAMATKRSLNGTLGARGIQETAIVTTKGYERRYESTLLLVTNIDLSRNNLSGDIPKELTSLVELRSLNLSGNHLTGLIPDSIGDMKQLESLDLSINSLSNEIPNGFTIMSSLNYLNLSYNNLTGRIPQSTQILGFNASSFIGNNLCGRPLPVNCSNDDEDGVPGTAYKEEEDNEGDKVSNIEWFYVLLSLGYAVGLSVVCTTLVLKKSWRDAYFGWLENMFGKVYVYFHIIWRRFTETSGPSS